MKNESRAYGSEFRDRVIWVTLLWVFTTVQLNRKRKSMRSSTDNGKQSHNHRPWFSWGT